MLQINICSNQVKKAHEKSKKVGILKGSFTRGMGNLIGFLGEIVVADYFNLDLDDTYDYDFKFKGKKFEIKTKTCSSEPKSFYECSVADSSIHQDCSHYIFVRISKDLKKAWILGFIEKNDFFSSGRHYKKGEIDPNSKNGWSFKADCTNIKISELKPINKLRI